MVTLGWEHLEEVRAQGRGAILALPHMGNWDQAGAWLVGRGISTGTLLGGLTYVLIGLQPALSTVMGA